MTRACIFIMHNNSFKPDSGGEIYLTRCHQHEGVDGKWLSLNGCPAADPRPVV